MPLAASETLTTRAFVGLGANQGDLATTLRVAIERLAALPATRLRGMSSFYATEPQDAGGPDYLNAVVELDTALSATELLTHLQRIEAEHGRVRPYRNAPRTLDLDLLLYGDMLIDSPDLTVPHPRLHQRAFALQPLVEVDPAVVIPRRGPAIDWLASVADQRTQKLAG